MIGTILRIRYELLQEIDDDGVFTCFRARDRVAGRDVSIRVLNPPMASEAAFVAKLREIVLRTSAVHHPGLERISEIDEHDGVPFAVGEISDGQSLEERVKKLAPFSSAVVVATAIAICEALDALHTAGLVHGDIGAQRIVVNNDGSVRLQLAGIWESYSSSRRAGAIALPEMAPALAPEITDGAMPSPGSDIYAIGVLMFRMLTGRFPFSGDTPGSIAVKHATAPAPSVRSQNPAVPVALDSIVRKAMMKSPADRYPDVRALLADLRSAQDALRFGRSMNWTVGEAKSDARQPIAPKMNVVQDELKKRRSETGRERREELDYSEQMPKWLSFLGYICIGVLVCAIGGWIFFNLSKPKEIPVPDVVRLSVSEASKRLELAKLKMKISRREASDEFPEGTVMDTDPRVGDRAKEGGTIAVTVSSGNQFVVVPDLKGRTIEDAKDVLSAMGLTLDDRVVEVRDRNAERGIIVSQLPESRRKVQKGSRVRVHVSGGSRGGSEPAYGAAHVYTLKITLPSGDSNLVVRVDMTDDRETKTVYEEPHAPGDEFEVSAEGYGQEATFRIFFDNELVKQVTQSAEDAKPKEDGQ